MVPQAADIHNGFGNLLRKTGRTKEAIEHYQAALQLEPNSAGAYGNLAQALASVGRTNEAIAAAQKGIEIARATGNRAMTEQLEECLKDCRESQRNNARPSTP